MSRKSRLLLILAIAFVFIGCGIKGYDIYVNKSYQYGQSGKPKLTILPVTVTGNLSNVSLMNKETGKREGIQSIVNTNFDRQFSKTEEHLLVSSPEKMNKLMAESADVKAMIGKINSQHYSKEELRNPPNLNQLLGDSAFNTLRSKLQSDILLVVVNFELNEVSSHTFSRSKVRLYDLHSGSLVYEVARNLNVNQIGEQGAVIATIVLVARLYSDYEVSLPRFDGHPK